MQHVFMCVYVCVVGMHPHSICLSILMLAACSMYLCVFVHTIYVRMFVCVMSGKQETEDLVIFKPLSLSLSLQYKMHVTRYPNASHIRHSFFNHCLIVCLCFLLTLQVALNGSVHGLSTSRN